MDFKRIEWIFLVVFIGINIFLGIELWQTPTLLSAGSTPAQTDIKSETSADQITIPKVNDKQEDGYYLAAKVDNSWSQGQLFCLLRTVQVLSVMHVEVR